MLPWVDTTYSSNHKFLYNIHCMYQTSNGDHIIEPRIANEELHMHEFPRVWLFVRNSMFDYAVTIDMVYSMFDAEHSMFDTKLKIRCLIGRAGVSPPSRISGAIFISHTATVYAFLFMHPDGEKYRKNCVQYWKQHVAIRKTRAFPPQGTTHLSQRRAHRPVQ